MDIGCTSWSNLVTHYRLGTYEFPILGGFMISLADRGSCRALPGWAAIVSKEKRSAFRRSVLLG
jgi:hypothetical protein